MLATQLHMPDCDLGLDEVPDLYQRLELLRASGPVVRVKYLGEPVWLINDYAILREAFGDEEHFSSESAYRIHSEPSMGRTLQTMSGDMHRVNRGLVSRPFFPARIRELTASLLQPLAEQLVETFSASQPLDLMQAYCLPYPFSVITAMLGLPMAANEQFLRWASKIIDYPWDPEGAVQAREEFSDYLAPLVQQRRRDPGADILSLLAGAEVEGQRLNDEEIFAFCRLLFPAGSDTTYRNLGSLIYAVLSHPGMVERVLAGAESCAAVVQEGLRWQPPTALLPRRCSKSRELGGVAVEAGDWILYGISAANSDPKVFEDARNFDPDRQHKNLSFGHGTHFCLGSHLARRELEVAIQVLFRRFPDMQLLPGKPVDMIQCVLRGPRELWVLPAP